VLLASLHWVSLCAAAEQYRPDLRVVRATFAFAQQSPLSLVCHLDAQTITATQRLRHWLALFRRASVSALPFDLYFISKLSKDKISLQPSRGDDDLAPVLAQKLSSILLDCLTRSREGQIVWQDCDAASLDIESAFSIAQSLFAPVEPLLALLNAKKDDSDASQAHGAAKQLIMQDEANE
jgi:hypothetical protein